jgi:hypothetical protein
MKARDAIAFAAGVLVTVAVFAVLMLATQPGGMP